MVMMGPLGNLEKYKVVLASASPRRRELLGMLGIEFEVRKLSDVDESYPPELGAADVPLYLARLKACEAGKKLAEGELVITADTVVICDGAVLGKPHDADDARRMLRMLSGRTHRVVTGVSLTSVCGSVSDSAFTDVTFAPLTDDEVDYYVERYRPFDKAGAYGIQEWIGCIGVRHISGSFYNVMGLPLHLLYTLLRRF